MVCFFLNKKKLKTPFLKGNLNRYEFGAWPEMVHGGALMES